MKPYGFMKELKKPFQPKILVVRIRPSETKSIRPPTPVLDRLAVLLRVATLQR